eukprot:759214-Hanusia_phi.AAC.9
MQEALTSRSCALHTRGGGGGGGGGRKDHLPQQAVLREAEQSLRVHQAPALEGDERDTLSYMHNP